MRKLQTILLAYLILLTACSRTEASIPDQPSVNDPDIGIADQDNPNMSISDEEPFLPLEVKESGFVMHGDYLYCAVILYNPNENYCVEFPTFRITARDADGLLLGTDDQVLSIIYPQQEFCHASLAFKVEEAPASVDIEIVPPEDYNIEDVSLTDHPDFKPLMAVNPVVREDKVLCEIENPNDFAINSTIATVIFRNESGDITYGTSTFPDGIPASSSIPVSISVDEEFVTDTYAVYANMW